MYFRDVLRIARVNALRGKARSILTILSVFIGIASVFLVSSIGSSGEALIMQEVDKMGLQGLSLYKTKDETSKPLTDNDVKLLKNRFSGIEKAMPLIMETGSYKLNKLSSSAVVFGVGQDADDVYSIRLLYGRIPNSSDVKAKARVAVVDDELARKAYKRDNIVGKDIVIKLDGTSQKFNIIGVISSQKDGFNKLLGNNIPDFVYLPYTSLNELRNSKEIDQIAIKCNGEYDSDGSEFAKYLSNIKAVPNGYTSENISTQIDEVKTITSLVSLLISAIAGIALCVAGLGVMNTMFSSTVERKREIGICMAIGASSSDILKCHLAESIIIVLIGGTLGTAAGYFLSYLISYVLRIGFEFNLSKIIVAEIFSIIFGGVFSVIPAIKASKMQPIDALRQE